MTIGELLEKYKTLGRDCVNVVIITKDFDMGDYITIYDGTVEKLLTHANTTEIRIRKFLYWWVHVSVGEYKICIAL
jgi:hypothetical protein